MHILAGIAQWAVQNPALLYVVVAVTFCIAMIGVAVVRPHGPSSGGPQLVL
jgi:hypothetical protein